MFNFFKKKKKKIPRYEVTVDETDNYIIISPEEEIIFQGDYESCLKQLQIILNEVSKS